MENPVRKDGIFFLNSEIFYSETQKKIQQSLKGNTMDARGVIFF